MRRFRAGYRNHIARFDEYAGDADIHGQPQYTDSTQWDTVLRQWPAELIPTTGGETIRGRQVTAQTTHVLFGSYHGAEMLTAEMRCVLEGKTYGVVRVSNEEGRQQEIRVELKWES